MNLDHLFLEVGFSDAAAASVTGIAVVRTDRKGKVLGAYSELVSIRGLDGVYHGIVDSLISPYAEKIVIVSQHSAAFRAALPAAYFRGKPWLDIAQLAWPLGYCDMISDRELDTICKHFGIKCEAEEGSISGNCEALVRAYWALMTRYRTALIGEEAVRDFGGEALQKLRRFVGV